MRVSADDYERMRAWFACIIPFVSSSGAPSGDAGPLKTLDWMAERSPAKARQGLSMAVNDIVEQTIGWSPEAVAEIDRRLCDAGVPTLSEVRVKFSRAVSRVLRRGEIRDDVEYYAVRNAAELDGEDRDRLWHLLARYEERSAP